MTVRRAVVVHDPCPHGTHLGPHYTDPEETVESLCKGGPHRLLEPGRYVLVERDEDGEWPVWARVAIDEVATYYRRSIRRPTREILDALAQEPT